MKKLVIMVAVATLSLSFIACGGKAETKTEDSTNTPAETTTEAKTEGTALDKYEVLITKYIELFEKVQKGDATAAQELGKLTEEMAPLAQQLGQEIATMTPEQQKRFQDLAQKLMDAAQATTK